MDNLTKILVISLLITYISVLFIGIVTILTPQSKTTKTDRQALNDLKTCLSDPMCDYDLTIYNN